VLPKNRGATPTIFWGKGGMDSAFQESGIRSQGSECHHSARSEAKSQNPHRCSYQKVSGFAGAFWVTSTGKK
jgi:hypothetical protein